MAIDRHGPAGDVAPDDQPTDDRRHDHDDQGHDPHDDEYAADAANNNRRPNVYMVAGADNEIQLPYRYQPDHEVPADLLPGSRPRA